MVVDMVTSAGRLPETTVNDTAGTTVVDMAISAEYAVQDVAAGNTEVAISGTTCPSVLRPQQPTPSAVWVHPLYCPSPTR